MKSLLAVALEPSGVCCFSQRWIRMMMINRRFCFQLPSVRLSRRPNLALTLTHGNKSNHFNMSIDIGGMRIPYRSNVNVFTESDLVSKEPITQFQDWFDLACRTIEIQEPNAMCLSTATKDGRPSARMVLLKGYGNDGFKFFTSYSSRKGQELKENPFAALTLYWQPLKRQVRIEGRVERLSDAESAVYFATRPRDSQMAACASEQSQPISDRQALDAKLTTVQQQYTDPDKEITKPENWGGYKVIPESIEFWQGQTMRLHDRIKFRRVEKDIPEETAIDSWIIERLQP